MPPKKKKGKRSGKLAKMTEEEKRIFMEQQRLAEEEMRRQKEEMLAQFLKNKLAKEEKMTKQSLTKINDQWRTLMREAKTKELRKELEVLSQTIERVIDRKNSVIVSLGKDLAEAEEQYNMALRSHVQNVDNLIDIQRQRVDRLCAEFQDAKLTLEKEFDVERDHIERQHQREMHQLEDIIHAMDQTFLERENEAKQEFLSIRDEIKARNLEDKHLLRVQLEGQVEDLWGQFTAALIAYQDATEERRAKYEELKVKDEKSARTIDKQMRKLQRIADQTALIKSRMSLNAKENEEKNLTIKEDRDIMLLHYNELKSEMQKIRVAEQQRLTDLTVTSNAALKALKDKSRKAERILKLAEMCRKLESEEEKVLPFYATSITEEERQDIEQAVAEAATEQLTEEMHKYAPLEQFWKRYNKALLDKVALDRERAFTAQQNAHLRTLLKQYLDGISVSSESVAKDSSPLQIGAEPRGGGAGARLTGVPVTDSRVKRTTQQQSGTVIEAAHVSKQLIY